MTEFTTTTTTTVNCPDCEADKVIKIGKQSGQQRYRCKACDKKFRAGGKAEGRKMDAEMMGSAIRDYFTGKSYKQIAEGLKEEYDLDKEPSKATIYEWVRDYTDKAMSQMKGHKATTGGDWVADELMVDVGGQKMWLWNVMDSETRYILASHLTPRRDANAARVVMRKAVLAADGPPKTITTDKLKSYMSAIKSVLPDSRHIQSEGMRADINNNLSERLQGTFRDRIKTLRGLDSRKTGQRYLDGWVLTYNHFRGHESLRNKTPGYRAKVNPPFKEWADVVKAEAAPRPKVAKARPDSQSKPRLPVLPADQLEQPKVGKPITEAAAVEKGRRTKPELRPAVPQLRPPKKRVGPRPNMPRKRPRKLHPMAALRRDLKRAHTLSGQRRRR